MSYKYAITVDINEVYVEDDGAIIDVDNVSSMFWIGGPGLEPALFDTEDEAVRLAEQLTVVKP